MEDAVTSIYDQYEFNPKDMVSTYYNNQDMITDIDNTTEYIKGAPESSVSTAPEIDLRESRKEAVSSFLAFDGSDDEDNFSDRDNDQAITVQSLDAVEDTHQSDSKPFQQFIDSRTAESHSGASIRDHALSAPFEKNDDGTLKPKNIHARLLGEKGESTVRSRARTVKIEYNKSSSSNRTLVEHVHKMPKYQLDATKTPQKKMDSMSKTVKKAQLTTHKAPVSSKIPPVSLPLKQPLISSFLPKRGKENDPPRLP